jgi:NagD protein
MIRVPERLFEAYIFDIDGTVCLGEGLIPGAGEAIRRLRALGKRTVFLSNNTTRTRAAYAEHLTELGVATAPDDVVNSSLVMIDYLRQRMPAARLLVIGEEALIADLEAAGFTVTANGVGAEAVIASFDRGFSYAKLQAAFDAIRGGARFFATNADRYRPLLNGGEPDAAAVIAAIEACTDRRCEEIVGKPSRLTLDYLVAHLARRASDCIVIGDRLETDIQMARDASIASALVLTGATTPAMAESSDIRPTYVLRSLGEIVPAGLAGGA